MGSVSRPGTPANGGRILGVAGRARATKSGDGLVSTVWDARAVQEHGPLLSNAWHGLGCQAIPRCAFA
jgi:hypothetical protein